MFYICTFINREVGVSLTISNFCFFSYETRYNYIFSLHHLCSKCLRQRSRSTQRSKIVEKVDRYLNATIPVTYNHLLQGGYFNMPSALMGKEGEMGLGFSYVSPYHNYNLRYQFSSRVEISGNYRVFRGIPDPILSESGFGDRSDKGVNIKFALLTPKESNYALPGISIGFDDFLGTKKFESRYVVMTQVFNKLNAEASLGYGRHRIQGFFGGFTWFPFLRYNNALFQNIALSAEYDAIHYKSETHEPHPDGHKQKSPINFGLKYRAFNLVDLSASYVRGKKIAIAASAFLQLWLYCRDSMQKRRSAPL